MLKKKKKCLSEKPVPDDARACSELNDAQKCLFKESENNWAYRYECAMLTPIYQTELENPQSWCYNIFAAAKNKDPTSSAAMKKDPTSSAAMKKDPTSSAAIKKDPTSLGSFKSKYIY
ncbi:uncharacterized protein LOC126549078 isoform X2 [Aphis gossypii]|uniref:uncharacterized protein LOC126549078 isoform X2 n=1 Tax=Aphis gossypii TaxID=80765 RepID=UPI0021590460|nr:uncharacterized protein LOC126549078 isoform X2 [Aphis gossypii]